MVFHGLKRSFMFFFTLFALNFFKNDDNEDVKIALVGNMTDVQKQRCVQKEYGRHVCFFLVFLEFEIEEAMKKSDALSFRFISNSELMEFFSLTIFASHSFNFNSLNLSLAQGLLRKAIFLCGCID